MYDVVIVGAGPAGLSAAIASRKNGLNVLVLDEFPKPGGRLLGQLHQEPNGEWWNGVKESEKLIEQANELDVTIKNGVPVYHVEKTDNHFIEIGRASCRERVSLSVDNGCIMIESSKNRNVHINNCV